MKNKKNIVLALIAVIIYVVIFSLAQFGVLSRHTQSLLVPIGVNII